MQATVLKKTQSMSQKDCLGKYKVDDRFVIQYGTCIAVCRGTQVKLFPDGFPMAVKYRQSF